jgi:toxin-antitoxin system PIN domain toxin
VTVALLDVNLLVALTDARHVHHDLVHRWFARQVRQGWATCPITQNGLVRIISDPRYLGAGLLLAPALKYLRNLTDAPGHVFWPDDVSLTEARFNHRSFQGHRQLTDAYLLGLSERHDGLLATLDRGLSATALTSADPKRLVCLLP